MKRLEWNSVFAAWLKTVIFGSPLWPFVRSLPPFSLTGLWRADIGGGKLTDSCSSAALFVFQISHMQLLHLLSILSASHSEIQRLRALETGVDFVSFSWLGAWGLWRRAAILLSSDRSNQLSLYAPFLSSFSYSFLLKKRGGSVLHRRSSTISLALLSFLPCGLHLFQKRHFYWLLWLIDSNVQLQHLSVFCGSEFL